MIRENTRFAAAVVIGLVAVVIAVVALKSQPDVVERIVETPQGGTNIERFPRGATLGTQNVLWASGKIGAGANQASLRNLTGRDIYVDLAEVTSVANSGGTNTASSSMVFYVATSSTATFSNDYAAPTASYFLINGGLLGSSSPKLTLTSTSTDAGIGSLWVADREYVVVQMQEQFGCTEDPSGTTCETATSTNRGFDVEWRLRYHVPN